MNLTGIINEIDKAINAVLTPRELSPLKAWGLAERYYDDKYFFSGVQQGSEIVNCMFTDQYRCSWYHRELTGKYLTVENNYGDKLDKVEESNEIALIIFFHRSTLTAETVKDLFIGSIPSVLNKVICESLQLFDCRIELINHDLDARVVQQSETNVPEVRVGLNYGLVSVRYLIKTTYRRSCIELCKNC